MALMRVAAFLLACSVAASASAATIVDPQLPPPGLAPGSVYQRLWVSTVDYPIFTSSTYPPSGDVGGLAGGDYNVTYEAYAAGWIPDWDGDEILFHAILSDETTNARDRLSIVGPIYNLGNELIASDAADLWDGTIDHAIRYDVFGNSVPDGTRVWAGCTAQGTKSTGNNCGSWLNPNTFGFTGNPNDITLNWIVITEMQCNQSARLYGLSDPLTVPQPGDFNGDLAVDAADYVTCARTPARPPITTAGGAILASRFPPAARPRPRPSPNRPPSY